MTTNLLDKLKANAAEADRAIGDDGGKFLTFMLAGESCGVEILKVREIIGLLDVTAVPQMPRYMKGVVNLRGKVIPVIDLRLKFGLAEEEHTEQTCIIVVDIGKEVGMIVDTVSEVLDVAATDIEPLPAMGGSVDTSFILGMGKVGELVILLLRIDQVLGGDDLTEIDVAAGAENASLPDLDASHVDRETMSR